MKASIVIILVALLVGLAQSAAASSTYATIGFSPKGSLSYSQDTITLSGSTSYSVDVVVHLLSPADQIVSAYDLNIFYDSVLTPSAISFSSWLGNLNTTAFAGSDFDLGVPSSGPGLFNFWSLSTLYDANQTPPDKQLIDLQQSAASYPYITLATVDFTASSSAASSTLSFDWSPGKDVKGLTVNGEAQVILPTAVPEPSTYVLLGISLVAVGYARKKMVAREI